MIKTLDIPKTMAKKKKLFSKKMSAQLIFSGINRKKKTRTQSFGSKYCFSKKNYKKLN